MYDSKSIKGFFDDFAELNANLLNGALVYAIKISNENVYTLCSRKKMQYT